MSSMRNAVRLILVCAVLVHAFGAAASEKRETTLHLELGAVWQERNKVQIPNDQRGDKFSLKDIAGSGPWGAARLEASTQITGRHGVRFLYAPLSYDESGRLPKSTRFAGATYAPDRPVNAEYTFDSWRLGYRYHLYAEPDWDFWVGATLNVRDAKVELRQGETNSQDDDIGVVPLLYLAGEYRFGERLSLTADLEGLAGGPGRVIDLGVRLNYELSEDWQAGLGYRMLEGGADTDDVYNFAWFHAFVLAVDYRF